MKKFMLALALLSGVTLSAKKPLDHDAFDSWNNVRIHPMSLQGKWAAYSINPQEGDGRLVFHNVAKGRDIVIERGYRPAFTADEKWAIALIKPLFADTRKAKIDKKKDDEMPKDSLAIVNLITGNVEKIPNVSSYKIGKDGGDWLAWSSTDTTFVTPKALKDKKCGRPLVLRHLSDGSQKVIPWVKEYSLSRLGDRLAAYTKPHSSDSLATDRMLMLNLPDTTEYELLKSQKYYGAPVFSRQGDKLAFTATNDSNETGIRRYDLYLAKTGGKPVAEKQYVLPTVNAGKMPHIMPPRITDESKRDSIMQVMRDKVTRLAGDSLFVSQYTTPEFSWNGDRLVVGVSRYVAPDDTTIVSFEQPSLDIWRWDAPYTPPIEKANLKQMKAQTYPIVIDLVSGQENLLTDSDLVSVAAPWRWDGMWALLRDQEPYVISRQWDYSAPEDLYVENVLTGEKKAVGQAPTDLSELSPEGKYVTWFHDRKYNIYNIATGDIVVVGNDQITFPLWEEEQDIPMERQPYGIMGWTAGDGAMLVYDRHDIWSIDPTGKTAPVNLTKGEGRSRNLRFRYVKTDPEKINFNKGDEVLLDVFDYTTKENGLALLRIGAPAAPQIKVLDKYKFTQIAKAKEAPVYAFNKSNFNTSPNVWIARGADFKNAKRVTDANPQMKEYSWGDAQLVKWYAYNGQLTEGVLYTPEDLDPNKKYPMLVVFYETNSEELYRHYVMEPSWSWVNYPFYVSRGYVVFVPDVHYTPGVPGESAYNYICSGVDYLLDKYKFIDKDRIGIDGQSWGGYQTAYLVTRTDMFACAGSGAPVSNMTSAFGGIRWGSGDSRQAQYEKGQSRIGRSLWEAPELYIANSPLFKADRVHTPLLIMHNDEDGAVPWYQGIEYFMALRRLGKPVWMLQYNGEAHNLKERRNRKDITHRLQEFFDYYLKGGEMPRWMKEGIPMTRKGQELRYGSGE